MTTPVLLRARLAAALMDACPRDGLCPAFITTDPMGITEGRSCESTFPTALALSALAHAGIDTIRDRFVTACVPALQAQSGPFGSWNYWRRGSVDAATTPYPDDLDTTCCTLVALAESASQSLDGKTLAQAVTLLMANETKPGGPYRTWLVPPDANNAWQDVDPAVNANIGRFLYSQNVALPGLIAYADVCLTHGSPRSPYYPSDIPTLYFLSSWYRGAATIAAIHRLHAMQKPDGSWGTPVETAMAVTALMRWERHPGAEAKRGIAYILQWETGALLSPFALCTNAIHGARMEYLGAPATSGALCLEALATFVTTDAPTPVSRHINNHGQNNQQAAYHAAAVLHATQRIKTFPELLQPPLAACLARVADAPTGPQVTTLPFLVADALPSHARMRVPHEWLMALAEANLFGWMGYTLYDDLLDDDASVETLPAANTCLRLLTDTFLHALPGHAAFRALFHGIMNGMEAANAWELLHWRLRPHSDGFLLPNDIPEQDDILAARSLGHALPALAILCRIGQSSDSTDLAHVRTFFTHFLIARQLDDDAHDWEADLQKGQINRVSADLLNAWMTQHQTTALSATDIPALRTFFWEQRIQHICASIRTHCDQAETALRAVTCLETPSALLALLAPPRASAQRAQEEQKRMSDFLEIYIQKR